MIALAAPPTSAYALTDWRKVPLLLSGRWPRELPWQKIVRKALHVADWLRTAQTTPRVSIDVEGTDEISVIGLAAVGVPETLLIDWRGTDQGHKIAIMNLMAAWLTFVPVVGHWVARDIAMLTAVGFPMPAHIDDSGIAHAVAFPGQPHSLVHACSTLGQYGWTKHGPFHTQGDVLGALDAWYGCEREIGPSRIVEGVELNARRAKYEWHRTRTLTTAIENWRNGVETRYVASVDPTFAKEAV